MFDFPVPCLGLVLVITLVKLIICRGQLYVTVRCAGQTEFMIY